MDGGSDTHGGVAEKVWRDVVAMQSTGVYWIAVYEVLERKGSTFTW